MDKRLSPEANNRYSYIALALAMGLVLLCIGVVYTDTEIKTADRYPAAQAYADQQKILAESEREISMALRRHEALDGHGDIVARLDALEERVSALEAGE